MAETGGTSTLIGEVNAAIAQGTASTTILGGSLSGLPNSTRHLFSINASHSLVTLVTMVAPSPDWFLGVHGLPLLTPEGWRRRVVVDLWPYDAGTDSGSNFVSPDADTDPADPITRLDGFPFTGTPPLGTFTFTIQPNSLVGDFDLDGQVGNVDAAAWESGFGASIPGGAVVLDGDATGDGLVGGDDFLRWQQSYGSQLAASGSVGGVSRPNTGSGLTQVPEPGALLLALLALSCRVPKSCAAGRFQA
jgi:hypothetical protein